MQAYNKSDDVYLSEMGSLERCQKWAIQELQSGKAQRVVIANLKIGTLFYLNGIKFEITEIVEDETSIKAKLYTGKDKPGKPRSKEGRHERSD